MPNKYSYLIVFMCSLLNFYCETIKPGNQIKSTSDTLFLPNQIVIKYNYNLDTVKVPTILESTTIMISDSMIKTKEYKILRYDRKIDSLNFMNCAYDNIPVRHYYIHENVMNCDIYFSTQAGWFFFGKIESDPDHNIVFKHGQLKKTEGYGDDPVYSCIKLKVFIPKHYTITSVKFHCR